MEDISRATEISSVRPFTSPIHAFPAYGLTSHPSPFYLYPTPTLILRVCIEARGSDRADCFLSGFAFLNPSAAYEHWPGRPLALMANESAKTPVSDSVQRPSYEFSQSSAFSRNRPVRYAYATPDLSISVASTGVSMEYINAILKADVVHSVSPGLLLCMTVHNDIVAVILWSDGQLRSVNIFFKDATARRLMLGK